MKRSKLLTGLLSLGLTAALLNPFSVLATAEGAAADTGIATNSIEGWPQGPDITSNAAVIMEDSTNTILYAKNKDAALYPSSITKIMTTLIALENSSLADTVTMTQTGTAASGNGSVSLNAQVGETFTMEQCLYAIMLGSANDISTQIAEQVGGSVENFVTMMNQKAKDLGCTNTNFTNPTGLPDEKQTSTAYDLALIMQAALKNESFQTIASAMTYTIPATNLTSAERNLTNNFPLSTATSASYYEGTLGGKSDYTEASGSTLAAGASRNGTTLICVVLSGTEQQVPPEAITLLDYGFSNFQTISVTDELNTISGGTAVIPSTASADDVTVENTGTTDDGISQQFTYHGTPVGTAVVDEEEDSPGPSADTQASKAKEDPLSPLPFVLIFGAGIVLLGLLGYLMRKVIKS